MNENTARQLDDFARQVREQIDKMHATKGKNAAQLQTELSQHIIQQTQALMAKGIPITKIQDAVRAATDIVPQTHAPDADADENLNNKGDNAEITCFLPLDDSIIDSYATGKLTETALLKLLRDSPEIETFDMLQGIDLMLGDYGKTDVYDDVTGNGEIVTAPDGEAFMPEHLDKKKPDGRQIVLCEPAVFKPASNVQTIAALLKPVDAAAFLEKFDINKLLETGYLAGYDSDFIKVEADYIADTLCEEYVQLRNLYNHAAENSKGMLIFMKYI